MLDIYIYRIYYIKINYMFRPFTMAIFRFRLKMLINPLAPELFFFKFKHILYIKCE